jgi:hypothetical protein
LLPYFKAKEIAMQEIQTFVKYFYRLADKYNRVDPFPYQPEMGGEFFAFISQQRTSCLQTRSY